LATILFTSLLVQNGREVQE